MTALLDLIGEDGELPDLPIGTRIGHLVQGVRCYVKGPWQEGSGEWRLPIGSLTDDVNEDQWQTYLCATESSLSGWFLCPIISAKKGN